MDGSLQVKLLKCIRRMVLNLDCRQFISLGTEARKSATIRRASRQESLNLNMAGSIAEEMGLVRFLHIT